MLGRKTSQRGFSVPELMVGMVVGMIVVSGVISLYTTTIQTSSGNLRSARLNQELRAVLGIIANDIRRAGYWAAQPGIDDVSTNVFHQGENDIAVAGFGGVADACVTYAYDLDKDKAVGDGTAGTSMELFGFRRNGTAVQMRTGNGSPLNCTSGNWEDLTDTNTEITDLAFELSETCLNVTTGASGACPCTSGDACQTIRQVDITIAGRVGKDNQVRQTLTESVRVRNDKFVMASP